MPAKIKDPQAVLDFGWNWRADVKPWLGPTETITTSTWSSTPAGLTIVSSSNTDTTTAVRLAGGTLGAVYEVVNHIVSSLGQEDDQTIHILIRNT